MRKMFFILGLSFVFLPFTGQAQKSRVGITLGPTFSNLYGNGVGQTANDGMKAGFTLGLVMQTPLCGHFDFLPGLYYVQKGRVSQEAIGIVKSKKSIGLRYVEVPFDFVYNTNPGGTNFFIGAGPYAAFNVPSKNITKVSGSKTESDVIFGNTSASDVRGIDYGAQAIIGFRIKSNWSLSANYDFGIRNLYPTGEGGVIRNGSFAFQLGVMINNKKK
jgi:hypothetical protein